MTFPKILSDNLHKAHVFVNFYGNAKSVFALAGLQTSLIKTFQLKPHHKRKHAWRNTASKYYLYCFQRENDTIVLQLIMTCQANKLAWQNESKELHALLNDNLLISVWGYSLIYQATYCSQHSTTLESRQTLAADVLNCMQPFIGTHTKQIAFSKLNSGHVRLYKTPIEKHGIEASMIYVALTTTEHEKTMLKTFGDVTAPFTNPDVIAHKIYHQVRQYRHPEKLDALKMKLQNMQYDAGRILKKLQPEALGLLAENRTQYYLTEDYGDLVGDVRPFFERMRISLGKQQTNYHVAWQQDNESNTIQLDYEQERDIFEHHGIHLTSALSELDLLNVQTEHVSTAVHTALEAVRTESELKRQILENQFVTVLTILGTVVTVTQLVNKEMTTCIFAILIPYLVEESIALDLIAKVMAENSMEGGIVQFIIQLLLTIIISLIVLAWKNGWFDAR